MNTHLSNSQEIYINSKDKKNLNTLSILSQKINQKLIQINNKKQLKLLKYDKINFKNKTHLKTYHKLQNKQMLMKIKYQIISSN
jgi:hypothetical protein